VRTNFVKGRIYIVLKRGGINENWPLFGWHRRSWRWWFDAVMAGLRYSTPSFHFLLFFAFLFTLMLLLNFTDKTIVPFSVVDLGLPKVKALGVFCHIQGDNLMMIRHLASYIYQMYFGWKWWLVGVGAWWIHSLLLWSSGQAYPPLLVCVLVLLVMHQNHKTLNIQQLSPISNSHNFFLD